MHVLFVCTANVCRSPSAERLLRGAVRARPALADVVVASAGTDALDGMRGCQVALQGDAGRGHRSRALTTDLVEWADLILTMERAHASYVLAMVPTARSRTFLLRRAAATALWLRSTGMVEAARSRASGDGPGTADGLDPTDPRALVEPMPVEPEQRFGWVVRELDAGRGAVVTARPEQREAGPVLRWGLRRPPERTPPQTGATADDVPDPHVLGLALHGAVHELIQDSVDAIVGLLDDVQR